MRKKKKQTSELMVHIIFPNDFSTPFYVSMCKGSIPWPQMEIHLNTDVGPVIKWPVKTESIFKWEFDIV